MSEIVIGAIVCAVGFILLIVEMRAASRHRARCAPLARAEGVVDRIARRLWHSRNEPTSDDRVGATPVVRFRAADGVEYEFDSEDAPATPGAKLTVAYDASSPSTAYVFERPRSRYGCGVIFFLAGLAFVIWKTLIAP